MNRPTLLVAISSTVLLLTAGLLRSADYPLQPVPFNEVEMTSDFWRPRLEMQRRTLTGERANGRPSIASGGTSPTRECTSPAGSERCTDRPDVDRIAAAGTDGGLRDMLIAVVTAEAFGRN